jgi:AraC family transcriptional regulator of arabinose operon
MALLPKNLTLLPKVSTINQGISEDIACAGRRLTEPRSYFKGYPDEAPLTPGNIIMFSRSSAKYLTRGGERVIPPHHRFVLVAALAGEGKICVGPTTHHLGEGEALLIAPFQSHCFLEIEPEAIDWIFTTFELPRDERLEVRGERGAWGMDEEEVNILQRLLHSWLDRRQRGDLPLHLGLWLQRIVRKVVVPKVKARRWKDGDSAGLVAAVNRFALENMTLPLSIPIVATGLGLSSSSLRSRFKSASGKSLAAHLREIKLYHACELLHDTQLRIGEISSRCGYDSLFAFSRAFRTAYKVSPRDYRAQYFSDVA